MNRLFPPPSPACSGRPGLRGFQKIHCKRPAPRCPQIWQARVCVRTDREGNLLVVENESWVEVDLDSPILNGKTVTELQAANAHSLALCSDGSIANWSFRQYWIARQWRHSQQQCPGGCRGIRHRQRQKIHRAGQWPERQPRHGPHCNSTFPRLHVGTLPATPAKCSEISSRNQAANRHPHHEFSILTALPRQ